MTSTKTEMYLNDLHEILEECLEYFEGCADADYQGEETGYVPNEEMVLSEKIRQIIKCVTMLPMTLTYKVFTKDDKWKLIATFAVLDEAVKYAADKQQEENGIYKVMNRRKNVHILDAF